MDGTENAEFLITGSRWAYFSSRRWTTRWISQHRKWILAHYDLGWLYEAQADTACAVDAYADFLDIWREADRDIPSVIDARKRVAALTGEVGDPS